MLHISFEGFTRIYIPLSFVGLFTPRSKCLAVCWKVHAEIGMNRLGIGIHFLLWGLSMIEVGIAVLRGYEVFL